MEKTIEAIPWSYFAFSQLIVLKLICELNEIKYIYVFYIYIHICESKFSSSKSRIYFGSTTVIHWKIGLAITRALQQKYQDLKEILKKYIFLIYHKMFENLRKRGILRKVNFLN